MYTIVRKNLVIFFASLAIICIFLVAIGLGVAYASTQNIAISTQFTKLTQHLPSQLLDRKGRIITEFFSSEKRELAPIDELPRHLIDALITREDQNFFHHYGFSIRGFSRAIWKLLTGQYISGGSTLTQQLAGTLYADRSEFSISRKIRELWWAFQLERNYTKKEILEQYVNTMAFGHGTYGVETASEFYFGHGARELSPAESALLVIQLANPSLYSPIRRPNRARTMQETILDQMVANNLLTHREAVLSLNAYWDNYDFSRSNTSTAFFDRKDKVPFYSEYIRYQLESELLLGSWDINKDGLRIYSSLDLDYQAEAERLMQEGLEKANRIYKQNASRYNASARNVTQVVNLLSLLYNIDELYVGTKTQEKAAKDYFQTELAGIVDLVSLVSGVSEESNVRLVVDETYQNIQSIERRTDVEGALITLDNDNGYILAMVGGSNFETRNQFNRATDALVEPGSSFKPLYYAAAVEKEIITPATLIYDSPVVFWNGDGTPYVPNNYKNEWAGPVLVRYALSRSMNVPSLKILERVGFHDALDIASRLLSVSQSDFEKRNFTYHYPVGLGVVAVAPIEMASAYSAFARGGKPVMPISVRYVEDRRRNIVINPEKDILQKQQGIKNIISPQTAYIMTSMLRTTVESGTLSYANRLVDGFDHPIAGKTGTTQNWSDAWTVGFSPYMTTAVWIGFDKGGSNSLGTNQTGAITTGPVWSQLMDYMHAELPHRDFIRPEGIVNTWVTAEGGLLPPENYDKRIINEIFVSGTEPTVFAQTATESIAEEDELIYRLRDQLENDFDLDDPLLFNSDFFETVGEQSVQSIPTDLTENNPITDSSLNDGEEESADSFRDVNLNLILSDDENPLLE